MSLLQVENLCVTYKVNGQRVYAVDDISFEMSEGKSLGVVGESGSGKSTLVHAVLRILNPRITEVTGKVAYKGGQDILQLTAAELGKLRWKEIAVVFQKAMNAISPVHRVGTFMCDVYKVHQPNATKVEAEKRMKELLAMVNLPERVYRMYPHELSGGMMQRVSIALSLMFNPSLLILDEATTALDVVTQTQILEEIKELEKRLNLTRIMVTHDMSVVASTCDEVAVLYAGKLLEMGPVKSTLVEPLHPYTRALIESFPDFTDEKGIECKSIPGSLPNLKIKATGCVFAPRCPDAQEACFNTLPPMKKYGEGRRAACILLEGGE